MGVGEREPGRVSDYPEFVIAHAQVEGYFQPFADRMAAIDACEAADSRRQVWQDLYAEFEKRRAQREA
jgi:hypothetical protein